MCIDLCFTTYSSTYRMVCWFMYRTSMCKLQSNIHISLKIVSQAQKCCIWSKFAYLVKWMNWFEKVMPLGILNILCLVELLAFLSWLLSLFGFYNIIFSLPIHTLVGFRFSSMMRLSWSLQQRLNFLLKEWLQLWIFVCAFQWLVAPVHCIKSCWLFIIKLKQFSKLYLALLTCSCW